MLATDYDEKRLVALPEVCIKVIPHADQRYPTVGDYWFDSEGVLQIRVSQMGNAKWEWLIATHELTEAMLCIMKGIQFEDITTFDKTFEQMRSEYPNIVGDDEPGDNENACPYFHEHNMATRIERWLADSTGVLWDEYNSKVNSL